MQTAIGRPHGFSEQSDLAIVRLAAFLVALAVSASTGHLIAPERWEYSEIADHILSGDGAYYDYLGTKYYFYGPSVFPRMLAMVLWLTGYREALMVVVQALFFALTAGEVCRIGFFLYGRRVALVSGLFAALQPGGLIYVGKIHSQTFDVFLIVWSFRLLLTIDRQTSVWKNMGAGIVAGLTVLSRGTMGPFFAVWGVWRLWRDRKDVALALRVILPVAMGGVLALAPVVAYGYAIYGTIIPLRTDTGVNLWYGNHHGASGTSYTTSAPPLPVVAELTSEFGHCIEGMNEIEQNEVFLQAVAQFWDAQPLEATMLFIKKLTYFWWLSPHTGLFYPPIWLVAYQMYYGVVILLGFVGVVGAIRSGAMTREGAMMLIMLAACVSIIQAIFYVEGRHRWQIEPLFMVFSAAGCHSIIHRLGHGQPTLA